MISISRLSYIHTSSLLLLGRQIWDNLPKSNSYWDSIQSRSKINLLIFMNELIQRSPFKFYFKCYVHHHFKLTTYSTSLYSSIFLYLLAPILTEFMYSMVQLTQSLTSTMYSKLNGLLHSYTNLPNTSIFQSHQRFWTSLKPHNLVMDFIMIMYDKKTSLLKELVSWTSTSINANSEAF